MAVYRQMRERLDFYHHLLTLLGSSEQGITLIGFFLFGLFKEWGQDKVKATEHLLI